MILQATRFAPLPAGHGGSQRAWAMLGALSRLGPVDLVLLARPGDPGLWKGPLDPARDLARSVRLVEVPGWDPPRRRLGPLHPGWAALLARGAEEAPRLQRAALDALAESLPTRSPEVLVAGRLPLAAILDDLGRRGPLRAGRRFADYDDVLSTFRAREAARRPPNQGRQSAWLDRAERLLIRRAELDLARRWDGVGVCSEEDAAALSAAAPGARVHRVPNVLDRPLLPARAPDGTLRLLFVGNLSFPPNVDGLLAFRDEAWPAIRAARPDARLRVVGFGPVPAVRALADEPGVEVVADAPSVEPHYADCDAVVVPVRFGSGTRVKILEAMAHGRPVVSTAMGAEGLGLRDGAEALLVPEVRDLAGAALRLAADPALAARLAGAARRAQQDRYGPPAMEAALRAALLV